MNPQMLLAWVAGLFIGSTLFSHTVAARLTLLGTGVVLAAISLARSRDLRPLPPIWIAFALWAGWAALSIAWSVDAERSEKEWRNEVVYTGLGMWVCYIAAQARQAPRILLSLAGAGAILVCLTAIVYFARGYATYYLQGPHGGPGNHSAAVLTLMPCALAACWHAWRAHWPRWTLALAAGCVLLLFASAYTTLNRTVWIGLAFEVVLFAVLVVRRLRLPAPQAYKVLIAVALASVAAAAAIVFDVQAERQKFGGHPILQDTRLVLWPEILERAAARPLTGYGFGRGLLGHSLQDELHSVDPFLWHAHNLFLEAMVQTGLPGMLLLIGLLAAIARAGWRLTKEADDAAAACGIALLGVLAGMLMRNMTDSLLVRQNALLFWAVTGALLGLAARPWRA